jgi:hypothetical protein
MFQNSYLVNADLTANRYHLIMQSNGQNSHPSRTGKSISLWLAFLAALLLHIVILLLPVTKRLYPEQQHVAQIEVQLSVPEIPDRTPPVQPEPVELSPPEPVAESPPETPQAMVEALDEVAPVEPQRPLMTSTAPVPKIPPSPEQLNVAEQKLLSATILSRQFISEKPVTEELFGGQYRPDSTEPQREFHYPLRPDLLAILDQPMPELPFAYTPGLVRFAYDPGVRGDLQRFWDVITPEFGWRTRYGTEVRCIYVLVIVACGWK